MGKDTGKAKKRGLFGLKKRNSSLDGESLLKDVKSSSISEGSKDPVFDYDAALKAHLKKQKSLDKEINRKLKEVKADYKSSISPSKAALKEIDSALKEDIKNIKSETKTVVDPLTVRLDFLNESIHNQTQDNPLIQPKIEVDILNDHPVKTLYDEHKEAFAKQQRKLLNTLKTSSKQWTTEYKAQLKVFKADLKTLLNTEKAQDKQFHTSIDHSVKELHDLSQKNLLQLDKLKDLSSQSIDSISQVFANLKSNQEKEIDSFNHSLTSHIDAMKKRFDEHFQELNIHLESLEADAELAEEKAFVNSLTTWLQNHHNQRESVLDAMYQSFNQLHETLTSETAQLENHLTQSLQNSLPQWHGQLTAWHHQFALYQHMSGQTKHEADVSMARIVNGIEENHASTLQHFHDYYQNLIEHYENTLEHYAQTYRTLFEEQLFLDNLDVFGDDLNQKAKKFAQTEQGRLKNVLNAFEVQFDLQQKSAELDYQLTVLELKAKHRYTPHEQHIALQELSSEQRNELISKEKELHDALLSLELSALDKQQEHLNTQNKLEQDITDLKKQHLLALSQSADDEEKEIQKLTQQSAKDKKALQQKINSLLKDLNNLESERQTFEENVVKEGHDTVKVDLADLIEKKERILSQLDGYEIDLKDSLKLLQKQTKEKQAPLNQELKSFEKSVAKVHKNLSAVQDGFSTRLNAYKTSVNEIRADAIALKEYAHGETFAELKDSLIGLIEQATQAQSFLLDEAPLSLSEKKKQADKAAFTKLIEAKVSKTQKTLNKAFQQTKVVTAKKNATKSRNSLLRFSDLIKQCFDELYEIIQKELSTTQTLLTQNHVKRLDEINIAVEKQQEKLQLSFNKTTKKWQKELALIKRALEVASQLTLQDVYEAHTTEREAFEQRRKAFQYDLSDTEILLNRTDEDLDYLIKNARQSFLQKREDLKYEHHTLLDKLNYEIASSKKASEAFLQELEHQKVQFNGAFDASKLDLASHHKQARIELEQFYQSKEQERASQIESYKLSYQNALSQALKTYKSEKAKLEESISKHEQWTLNIAYNVEEIMKDKKAQSLQNVNLLEQALERIQVEQRTHYETFYNSLKQGLLALPKQQDLSVVNAALQHDLDVLETELIHFTDKTYQDITNLLSKGGSK